MGSKLPLSAYTVALSGTFPNATHTSVQGTIVALGGSVAKSVTADTNILISTAADVKKASRKVQDAQSSGIPIVSIDWLDEAESSSGPVAPDNFLLDDKSSSTTDIKGKGKDKGKKRAASPDLSAPISKIPKIASLDPALKPEPKVGEGSVLKTRDMNIPLDEECPLQTYRVYVNDDGIVHDASLNKTDASANNNKFYRVQVCAWWFYYM